MTPLEIHQRTTELAKAFDAQGLIELFEPLSEQQQRTALEYVLEAVGKSATPEQKDRIYPFIQRFLPLLLQAVENPYLSAEVTPALLETVDELVRTDNFEAMRHLLHTSTHFATTEVISYVLKTYGMSLSNKWVAFMGEQNDLAAVRVRA